MDPEETQDVNILIVKLSAIGDVIHTLPSLAALRRRFPDAEITWVVEEAAADLLIGHPDLDRVLVSRRKGWLKDLRRGRIAAPLREMRAFLRDLRSRRYDLVIDFHGLLKSAFIVLLSGGKRKVGYDSLQEGSGLFYNEKIPEDLGKHAVDRYLDFVRHIGAQANEIRETAPPAVATAQEDEGKQGGAGAVFSPAPNEAPEFRIAIGEEEERSVADLLEESLEILTTEQSSGTNSETVKFSTRQGFGSEAGELLGRQSEGEKEGTTAEGFDGRELRFVAVNPVAFWETKLWEDGKFAALCDRIRTELGIGVVLTGGEAEPLERIRAGMTTEAANIGGKTSLRELACLYRRAALVVSTDSGPMHLAAATGTQVVALFGPTDPDRTGPYGPGHRVIRGDLPCMPCFRKRCEDPRCMKGIGVEEVFAAVKGMLEAKRKAGKEEFRGGTD
jgi:3-deoxy-D-manno-octulosonic-acid transferase/heptosyltransferase-1